MTRKFITVLLYYRTSCLVYIIDMDIVDIIIFGNLNMLRSSWLRLRTFYEMQWHRSQRSHTECNTPVIVLPT
jgi:hypothetical protein